MLTNWSECGLSFGRNKCKVMRKSRKRRSFLESLAVTPYAISDHLLALLSSSKDFRVSVNNKLTCNRQVSSVVAKENKTLGLVKRHFGSPSNLLPISYWLECRRVFVELKHTV